MEWLILIAIGFIAATIGSMVGLGGGIIIVPSLLFISANNLLTINLQPQNAVGISLMVIIINAVSATVYNLKQKTVDMQSGMFFFIASGLAAIIGSLVNEYLNIQQFYILFGLLMLSITFLLAYRNKIKLKGVKSDVQREYTDQQGNVYNYGYNKKIGFIIAGLAGLLGGLFGIGGGAILVPVMVVLFSFPPHVATATSMFIILLSASLGSISHIVLGNIIFSYVLIIGIGAFIGGRLGSYFAGKLSSNSLVAALRVVIVIIAIQMIYKGLAA